MRNINSNKDTKPKLTPEQQAEIDLHERFGYKRREERDGETGALTGGYRLGFQGSRGSPRTAQLQEYEKGIKDIVKSQNALMSSVRARMAASGQSVEEIDKKITELQGIFSQEITSLYERGGRDIREKFDPYGALKLRAKHYEVSSSGFSYGNMMEKAKGWKQWW